MPTQEAMSPLLELEHRPRGLALHTHGSGPLPIVGPVPGSTFAAVDNPVQTVQR